MKNDFRIDSTAKSKTLSGLWSTKLYIMVCVIVLRYVNYRVFAAKHRREKQETRPSVKPRLSSCIVDATKICSFFFWFVRS